MKIKNILSSKNLIIAAVLLLTQNSKAQSWSSVGAGTNGFVLALTVYNDSLIVGGDFTTAGGNPANNIAVWNGSSWSALGAGMNNAVHSLTVFNGNLYAGGDFTTAGGNPASEIAEWNGSSWTALGAGMKGLYSPPFFTGGVYALAGYNGNLYAGGEFDTAGGNPVNFIAKWNGTIWSSLDTGLPNYNEVYALTVYNGNLFVGGWVYSGVAECNGTTWSTPGSGIDGIAYALTVFNGNLYAGGQIYQGGYPINVEEWNGTSWSALGAGINEYHGVDALIAYNGNLYAGGEFDSAGRNPASNIAVWNGTSWSALGTGVNAPDSAFAVYNGCLYTGGEFTIADGTSANYIASKCGTAAIDEVSNIDNNELPYPNPTSSLIHLTYNLPEGINMGKLVITNISGQIVKTYNIDNALNYIVVDTKQYAAGEYIYNIYSSGNYISTSSKFIVK